MQVRHHVFGANLGLGHSPAHWIDVETPRQEPGVPLGGFPLGLPTFDTRGRTGHPDLQSEMEHAEDRVQIALEHKQLTGVRGLSEAHTGAELIGV